MTHNPFILAFLEVLLCVKKMKKRWDIFYARIYGALSKHFDTLFTNENAYKLQGEEGIKIDIQKQQIAHIISSKIITKLHSKKSYHMSTLHEEYCTKKCTYMDQKYTNWTKTSHVIFIIFFSWKASQKYENPPRIMWYFLCNF